MKTSTRDLAAKIVAYLEAEAPSVSMTSAEECRFSIITAALGFYGAAIDVEQFRCWSGILWEWANEPPR